LRADQNRILERIAARAPLDETLALLAQLVESSCPATWCTVLLLDEDGLHIRHGAAPRLPAAYVEAVDGLEIGPAAGSCGTAMFRREPVVVTDILRDPLWDAHRHLTAFIEGARACSSTPILADDQRVLGSFAMYYEQQRGPDAAESEAIGIATYLAGIAIERGRAEDALRRTAQRLADSESRYRSLFESAPDGILVADAQGVYVDANPACLDMLGYSRDELIGMGSADILAPKEHLRVDSALVEINQGVEHRREWQFQRKDGSVFPADVMATVMADGRILAMVRDSSDRKRMEEQLRQSQKMEAVGRLAGGIAHDFNNILGVILGYGELLRKKTPADHPDRRRLHEIVRAAERAAGLTRQLLAFSRKQVLEPRVLQVSAVVSDMRKLLQPLIGEDIAFVLKAEAKGRVKVDPGQLEQVLMNLVVNARDSMPMGGSLSVETVDVDLDQHYIQHHTVTVPPGRYVMVAVTDTGLGMDEATQAQVFEPFFTTKPEGKGTGLGLSTVYGIVKQSDGYIWLYSELRQGTVFRVYLPRVEEALAEAHRRPMTLSRSATETVLVVEDEPAARELVGEVLRAEGYSVLLAADGQEALTIAARADGRLHLLLTDVVLPKLSGRAAAEGILALHPSIKVVYMSGYTDDQISRHGVLEPGIVLLQKPFTPAELVRRVGEVLDEV
jgi:two-component system, cell cycle sensor histidine kinase and response regulator CckA